MFYLLLTTLIWAFSFGLIGNKLEGLDPFIIGASRMILALLVFLPFLRPQKISISEKCHLAAIGAVQFGTMYICYLSAFRFIPSHLVALFSVLTPVYVVLIHDLCHEKLHIRYFLAALLSVAGASVIKAKAGETDSVWIGFFLMQISGIAFAFGQVAYRDWKLKRESIEDREIFGFLYAGGAAVALLAAFAMASEPLELFKADWNQYTIILYLGVVASGLGFFLWNKGATRCSAGTLAAFNNAIVPVAVFVSLFIFGEVREATDEETVRLLLGALLIGLAVLAGRKTKTANGQPI